MNHERTILMGRALKLTCVIGLAVAAALLNGGVQSLAGQPQAAKSASTQLEITPVTTVTFRVQEQLAGVNFPTEAVGTTDAVTGTLVLAPDGSIDSAQSKLTIDMKTFKSDQDLRDNYIKGRTFESDKFPTAEFVPRKLEGVASPLPTTGQSGFQLTGDLTIHGMTAPVTLKGLATFSPTVVAGRATTDFTFSTFGLTKPTLARLLSVGDKIQLEFSFRTKRTS